MTSGPRSTTILINSELLQKALDGDGRNAQRAGALRAEAERLKALVDDYLDIVSAEAGRETRMVPGDLVQIAREALEGMPEPTLSRAAHRRAARWPACSTPRGSGSSSRTWWATR